MKASELKNKNLPDNPGVYFFKKGREILYIGKATSLRDRTRSYFSKDLIKTRGPAILDMVTQATNVTFEETDSVLEAMLLESALIKKYQPHYNVKEKDNRSYNYVLVTDENFPRIIMMRGREIQQRLEPDGKVRLKTKNNLPGNKPLKNNAVKIRNEFGPFPNSGQLVEALKIIRKIFPFYDAKAPSKLNEQIGLIPSSDISQTEYKRLIRNIELFFEGKKSKLVKNLTSQMKKTAKEQKFEQAEEIRKQIFALEHINDVSLISDENIRPEADFRIESYDIAHMSGKNTVGVMVVMEDGELNKNEYRKFIIRDAKAGDDYGALTEVLRRRLNHDEWTLPKLIVIDGGKAQKNVAHKVLKEFGYEIPVVSVVKDEYHKPKDILGDKKYIDKYATDILKVNQETHRFAISFHKNRRNIIK
jgi:excinuclease ABC subunit C